MAKRCSCGSQELPTGRKRKVKIFLLGPRFTARHGADFCCDLIQYEQEEGKYGKLPRRQAFAQI